MAESDEEWIVEIPKYSRMPLLTLIRECWKKNPKPGTITERVLRGKNPEYIVASFVYVSVLWIFCPENTLGDGPKKCILLYSKDCDFFHIKFVRKN